LETGSGIAPILRKITAATKHSHQGALQQFLLELGSSHRFHYSYARSMQRRLKILHVVISLEPGGMENGVVNVWRGLDPQQFEIHAACLERGGAFVERLPEPQNTYILNKQPGFSLATVFALAKVISKIKPDVVHTHNLGPLIYAALATAMGRTRRLLHGEHGFPQSQRTSKSLAQRRMLYGACKRVHAVSRGLADELIQFGMPAEKIEVVLNGVDTERFAPYSSESARREVGLPTTGPIIGMVGRFDPLKCHLPLIAAFEGLSQKLPAQLVIVGKGGQIYEQVVNRATTSPVANRIHMVGFQPEPKRYYQSMDLLVVPSLSEGLSNVVLEAMSCGVPVLGHTACGNAEIITSGKDGILANLKTAKELESEIINALRDPNRLQQIGISARQTILNRFSMPTMVANYANLYRRVATR
jgi:glycosyltransferase involved in cell wall biosynthesis